MDYVPTHLRIDDASVAAAEDIFSLVTPVWWIGDFYSTPEVLEASLAGFTAPQRRAWAMVWYLSEVHNGGHDQFYSNSTGAVWSEALAGFDDASLPQVAAILRESAERLGGAPSLDRDVRNTQLDEADPDFEDLDRALYALFDEVDVDARMLDYARTRPEAFRFDGVVMMPPPKA